MSRSSWKLAIPFAAAALLLGTGRSEAQAVIVTPAPTVAYYAPPPPPPVVVSSPYVVSSPVPTVTTYRYGILPRRVVVRSYYEAPVVTYSAPVVVTRPARTVYYYSPAVIYP
jgi:hypothetical protein